MTDDLVKRLREGDFYRADFYWEVDTDKADALCDQAADRIEALTAENERLRELLDAWLGLAREHLDTELAGRTFEALERTRK